MNEPGLLGFIRALRIHQEDFTEMLLAALIQYGADNPIELLVEHLRRWSENDLEYLSILQQTVPLMGQTAKGRKALIDSGALRTLVDICLDYSDSPVSAP